MTSITDISNTTDSTVTPDTQVTPDFFAKLKNLFWPIERHELRKFIPMALMMACISFNYSTLRSIKDGLVVTNIGPEAIGFIKGYFVMPMAIIFMLAYTKLCNIIPRRQLFYYICSFFLAYILFFAFVLYPNPDIFHPSEAFVNSWIDSYPTFKWFFKIIGNWSYVSFYIMSELWCSMMLSLLFWQFANQVTHTKEAVRFYPMFAIFNNMSMPLVFVVTSILLSPDIHIVPDHLKIVPVLLVTVVVGILAMVIYRWININIVDQDESLSKQEAAINKKPKLPLKDSLKMIVTSKYLGLLGLLVVSYGISINLVEVLWKAQIKQLYPTVEAYTAYMGSFMAFQGITSLLFMFIGANILRRVSWSKAASFTPAMILITGTIFFTLIIFQNSIGLTIAAFFGTSPLVIAITIGMVQNMLSKATKYSLFDSTKEMAYIPLDDEMKSKGKAAVDVLGTRFGKSGGAHIQAFIFMLAPGLSFYEATPYLAAIFFVVVIMWCFAIKSLSGKYSQKMKESGHSL